MDRDFKGVWIPKEIWLNTELKMLEKVIFTEINSLDNENHCTAGNEYFAEFCSCSLSAVSKTIKHLKELGYIEELDFDGRHRKLRVVNFTNQPSKIYYAESENLLPNNIYNNIQNTTNSKELVQQTKQPFEFGKSKPKKDNLYSKCVSLIRDYTFDSELQSALIDYLRVRLEMKDKPLYVNSWKGLLNKLDRDFDASERLDVVRQSIERGYASFFPVNSNYGLRTESGARHVPRMTADDYTEESHRRQVLEKMGVKTTF